MALTKRLLCQFIGLALCAISPCRASVSSTLTTFNLSPAGTVTPGTIITLEASVTSGGNPVTRGLVVFCNATAAHCLDAAILGQGQLTRSGSAKLKLRLGEGIHSIHAVFQGTSLLAKSTSSAESVTVAGLYPAPIVLAASGTPGTYTLTGTLTTSDLFTPSGTITFIDASHGNAPLGSVTLGPPAAPHGFVSSLITTSASTSVVVADFNLDGIPDMAITNAGLNTAYLLIGKGDGTFQAKPLPGVGITPSTIVTGDFNGDGIPDLAFPNEVDNDITVLIGVGDGTFDVKPSLPAGHQPQGMVVADFNNDGIPDIANTNANSNTVTLFLGNGDGTFVLGSSFGTGSFPYALTAGDFNGDGKMDLATVTYTSNTVNVSLGNGDGTFAPRTFINVGLHPESVAIGDFNGDGIIDLATANYSNDSGSTSTVLLGKGDGTFVIGSSPAIGDGGNFVAVADMNNDGISDLVTTNLDSMTVLLGNGDGTFTLLPSSSQLTGACCALAAVDLNGDGLADLVSGSFTSGFDFYVFLAQLASPVQVTAPLESGSYEIVASYSGDSHFAPSSAQLIVNVSAPAAPVLAPKPGTYSYTQSVTITDSTPGSAVYYTLDGSIPTKSSNQYTAPISVTWGATINAVAINSAGSVSPVVAGVYTIDRPLPPPIFSLVSGTYASPQTLTIADDPSYCDHATCLIYVTFDGSTPNTSSQKYAGPITLTAGTTTVKAIAASYHFMNSPEAIAHYTLH